MNVTLTTSSVRKGGYAPGEALGLHRQVRLQLSIPSRGMMQTSSHRMAPCFVLPTCSILTVTASHLILNSSSKSSGPASVAKISLKSIKKSSMLNVATSSQIRISKIFETQPLRASQVSHKPISTRCTSSISMSIPTPGTLLTSQAWKVFSRTMSHCLMPQNTPLRNPHFSKSLNLSSSRSFAVDKR